jgi:hypothetical protein
MLGCLLLAAAGLTDAAGKRGFRGFVGVTVFAGFTSHNTAARRASQFEYFGPASASFKPASYFGLALDRADAIQVIDRLRSLHRQ